MTLTHRIISRDSYAKAKEWLPLFRQLVILIQASSRSLLVILRNTQGNGTHKIRLGDSGSSCSCAWRSRESCEHVALVTMALRNSTSLDHVLQERVKWALNKFHKDTSLITSAISGSTGRNPGVYKSRRVGRTALCIYESDDIKLSILRGQVVDMICRNCGDIFVEKQRAACECSITALVDILR
jgi:hypothetical protein